jgi:hypothetical protein
MIIIKIDKVWYDLKCYISTRSVESDQRQQKKT